MCVCVCGCVRACVCACVRVCVAIHMERVFLESQVQCGVPNMSALNDEVRQRVGDRVKRVVGGTPAKPVTHFLPDSLFYFLSLKHTTCLV